jgi:hypothetical protein
VGVLIAMLYGTVSVVEAFGRVGTSYTHVGLIGYLVRNGGIDRYFDARLSWPGSLGLGAMLTQLGGTGTAQTFVRWAPVVFNVLYVAPLLVIGRSLLREERAAWLSTWLFLCLNWVGQDYFSPQALNYLLFLVVVAAAVTWFPRRAVRSSRVGRFLARADEAIDHSPGTRRGERALVVALLAAIVAASSISHQLTPFFLAAALFVVWALDRRDIGALPVFAIVIAVCWVSFGATRYWVGHLDTLTNSLGRVDSVVNAGVSQRLEGSGSSRLLILRARIGLSAAMWFASGAAALALLARRRLPVALVGLVAAPFLGVALQSYGGELLLRVFLFSLPFACGLIALGLVHVALPRRTVPGYVGLGLALLALVPCFVLARYGSERSDQVYAEDVAAERFLYATVPAGAQVVLPAGQSSVVKEGPYRSLRIRQDTALARPDVVDPLQELLPYLKTDVYVLVTKAQDGVATSALGAPPDWQEQLLYRLVTSTRAQLLFEDGSAKVIWVAAR